MMENSQDDLLRFSRYGMYPYNWIIEGKMMGSVYPSLEYLQFLNQKEGIELAINLTESPWDRDWSSSSGITCIHSPITDMSIPDPKEVRRLISLIDDHDGPVMIHCAAGIGRTGTLIGIYLTHHGMDPREAIRTIRKKRPGSIQTIAQETMILNWMS
jgi:atypical dual specificity phosphatase